MIDIAKRRVKWAKMNRGNARDAVNNREVAQTNGVIEKALQRFHRRNRASIGRQLEKRVQEEWNGENDLGLGA